MLAHRLVVPAGGSASTGGRPPTVLAFNRGAGVVLAADLGATHSRVAVTDLGGDVLAERRDDVRIADGPEAVLGWLETTFDAPLAEGGRIADDVRGVGVGVPGPVEFATGRPVAPPIMPGWDGYPVAGRLRERFRADARRQRRQRHGQREHAVRWREVEHLLFVKVGTGIGCGLVAGGRIHRGAQGAAGDLGHVHVPGHDDVLCRCGNVGCLEAVAGGAAIARRLREEGIEAGDSRDVVSLVRAGHPEAIQLVRQAGRTLGEVLAPCVTFFNPAVVVVGGDVAEAHEQLLAGVREVVYQRSLPLATRSLRVVRSELGDRAGVVGAALMVLDHALSPEAVDEVIAAAS